ncbi:metallophosphatase family protein [Telluria mixta]|uniref:Phosphoesterase n=1 Tax=Telluria mixta TaxID=34071 RepID=A0ABT2BTE5_9BURK|nr:metallophosphoesterase family protein [Telluria mixta]MCS0627946.1 metallophosphatase family protein [Telluria mixta]WEM93935.1 metallophosphoesterase family protein [Telluria mixta]
MRVGLISDTHGLLRPEALAFLAGSDHIVHGGDIGGPEILERLAAIAPLTVVRGNNDTAPWARTIPATARVEFGNVALYAIHDLKELDIDPRAAGVRVVVSGHSHKPACSERNGVLYVNPGSAGRRRFSLPIAAAELVIDGDAVAVKLVTLREMP